ncbi:Histidine phosphatase superfamily (branch 1) [Palleronia salina]|uniref:Histidine phosphatase superfamily (Branch 1) n=1 Tax=Palleronia salina TaxID=313368 RepID=A0A1M6H0G1_9RHOB|nr:histidine phosphatase family protein [Palleronia salina]SHJ15670.1 Histidine phosphatase superfamily (branch 1) [Palleronia salina]
MTLLRSVLIALCLAAPMSASANDWDRLSEPGVMAIMRHALAPGTGDPANFTLGDCSTQRTLDERGRDQARRLGAALRERGIRFDRVLTSQWCRSRETAELLEAGPVVEEAALNSTFAGRGDSGAQTRRMREIIAETDGRLMMVSHQVNICDLTGQSTRSGEVLLIRDGENGIEVVGEILVAP